MLRRLFAFVMWLTGVLWSVPASAQLRPPFIADIRNMGWGDPRFCPRLLIRIQDARVLFNGAPLPVYNFSGIAPGMRM